MTFEENIVKIRAEMINYAAFRFFKGNRYNAEDLYMDSVLKALKN